MNSGADNAAETRTSDNTVSQEIFTSLAVTMASVTWRMFVPTLSLFFAGLWLDSLLNSKPWLMLGGFAAGLIVAVALVRQQIEKVAKR